MSLDLNSTEQLCTGLKTAVGRRHPSDLKKTSKIRGVKLPVERFRNLTDVLKPNIKSSVSIILSTSFLFMLYVNCGDQMLPSISTLF